MKESRQGLTDREREQLRRNELRDRLLERTKPTVEGVAAGVEHVYEWTDKMYVLAERAGIYTGDISWSDSPLVVARQIALLGQSSDLSSLLDAEDKGKAS